MAKEVGVNVTQHILSQQAKHGTATGAFTRLLSELVFSAKIIAREVTKAGLLDILGFTGTSNVQGEQVRKLDEFARDIIVHRMGLSRNLAVMGSEEDADPRLRRRAKGEYCCHDPPGRLLQHRRQVSIGSSSASAQESRAPST